MARPHRNASSSPSIRRARRTLAAALVVIPCIVGDAEAQRGPLRGLEAYVEQGMRDWGVPGLALAVVKDDSVVFAR